MNQIHRHLYRVTFLSATAPVAIEADLLKYSEGYVMLIVAGGEEKRVVAVFNMATIASILEVES